MTGQDSDTSIMDPSNEVEVIDVGAMKEEMRKLKAQMAEMHRAWSQVHPTPLYPANSSYIPPPAQAQEPTTPHASSAFPYHTQGYGTTSFAPPTPPPKQNPPPPMVPVFVAPPPAPLHRSSSEPLFQAHDTHYYPPEPTFKVPEPYTYTPHFEIPGEVEKPVKNVEQEEVIRKVKSMEQSFRNMHGLGNQVSVAYKDLCPLPDVQLPAGFKMPKFDLYEGRGDPVDHLRGFCSKMRGSGGKDELLIAYFGQSLNGSALEWYTRQDPGRWYTWDDLAQAFIGHFQYNLEIVPDRLSLLKLEKKPAESFREFGFR
ncbi:uncharacterized protein [Nicotiana sylvestris]|uniref:uncharacterized protein n=1 Tax=Nicotiana sylvestris TaxID=4096 RepID=UPI00388CB5F7